MPQETPIGRTPPGEVPPRRRRTSSADDTPPKSTTTKPKPADPEPKPKQRTSADKKLAAQIANTYGMIGMAVTGVGLRLGDGGIAGAGAQTINQAEAIAEAWMDLCDTNPKVRTYLVKLTQVSATGTLIGLHVTILVPILASRGAIPIELANMIINGEPTSANGGDPNAN